MLTHGHLLLPDRLIGAWAAATADAKDLDSAIRLTGILLRRLSLTCSGNTDLSQCLPPYLYSGVQPAASSALALFPPSGGVCHVDGRARGLFLIAGVWSAFCTLLSTSIVTACRICMPALGKQREERGEALGDLVHTGSCYVVVWGAASACLVGMPHDLLCSCSCT
jgi:hypothetical protein